MKSIPILEKQNIQNFSKTQKNWHSLSHNSLNINVPTSNPYPVNNLKQKEFTTPRPVHEYTRFIPTKQALSGMDPQGTIAEFYNHDIIRPLKRPSLYSKFDIKNPFFKHNTFYKTHMNENSKWALGTEARPNDYSTLPKLQPFKNYYFPPKYNKKDPEKYRAFSLKTDHIGIKVPKIKKIEKKNSFLKLKEDYSVSTETKKENRWICYDSKNSIKNLSSTEYNIINFRPILGVNSNFEMMNKTLNCRKKGNGEYLDLTKTFRVNNNKDFIEKYESNPTRFRKFTGIFSNMYDAAHKNGNIIPPFGLKNKNNNGSK